jgi:hypothetical protein
MKISPTIIEPKTIRHINKNEYKLYNKRILKTLIDNISFSVTDDSKLEIKNEIITCIAKEYKLKQGASINTINAIDDKIIKEFVKTKQKLKNQQELIDNFYRDKIGNLNTLIDNKKQLQEQLAKLPDPIYGKINDDNTTITLVINKIAIQKLIESKKEEIK